MKNAFYYIIDAMTASKFKRNYQNQGVNCVQECWNSSHYFYFLFFFISLASLNVKKLYAIFLCSFNTNPIYKHSIVRINPPFSQYWIRRTRMKNFETARWMKEHKKTIILIIYRTWGLRSKLRRQKFESTIEHTWRWRLIVLCQMVVYTTGAFQTFSLYSQWPSLILIIDPHVPFIKMIDFSCSFIWLSQISFNVDSPLIKMVIW